MQDCSGLTGEEAQLEEEYMYRILLALRTYEERMRRKLTKHYHDWARLSSEEHALLPEYPAKLDQIVSLLSVNQRFFDEVVAAAVPRDEEDVPIWKEGGWPTDRDLENMRSTLRQLVRDWSREGVSERENCYRPILEAAAREFPVESCDRTAIKVLVPGAGLGRLAWELTRLGFTVQGNEFSLYMLFTSQFILNCCRTVEAHAIHPFAFPLSNHASTDSSLRAIRVPDVVPGDTASAGDFSMTAGDFLEVYGREEEAGSWDCVVTCFFLDTAQNVLRYLRLLHRLLKPGGRWINLGPLQYHFEGSTGETEHSIELSWTEIVSVAERIGFRFVPSHDKFVWMDQCYANDSLSLARTVYRSVFSTAHKANESGSAVLKTVMGESGEGQDPSSQQQ